MLILNCGMISEASNNPTLIGIYYLEKFDEFYHFTKNCDIYDAHKYYESIGNEILYNKNENNIDISKIDISKEDIIKNHTFIKNYDCKKLSKKEEIDFLKSSGCLPKIKAIRRDRKLNKILK